MTDFDIPPFLDLKDPENRAAHVAARKAWRPGTAKARQSGPKINRDREGRALPANMDAQSWAMLRALEKASETTGKQKLKALHAKEAAERREKRETKAAAKAAHKATKQ